MIYNNSKQRNGWKRCKVNTAAAARLTPVRRARAEVNECDVYLHATLCAAALAAQPLPVTTAIHCRRSPCMLRAKLIVNQSRLDNV